MAEKLDKEQLEKFYKELTPEQRRNRIILEPAFRDAYNEITQAHRLVPVPHYFWEKWVPVLGPVASMLYMRLRQYCYYNPETGEKRDHCWPKQETLGKEIGVSKRTVMRALPVLEEYGFIKREPNYRIGPHGAPNRATDVYRIYFEIPLRPEDAVELLLRNNTAGKSDTLVADFHTREGLITATAEDFSHKCQNVTYREKPYERQNVTHREIVDNSAHKCQNVTHKAVTKWHRRTNTITNTSNVNNVIKNVGKRKKQNSLRNHPAVVNLPASEIEFKESLVFEIGEQLKLMSGNRSSEPHPSEGFHRRVAFLMPDNFIREALSATRDAIDDQRAGRKSLRSGASAYFAGVIKEIAKRESLDIGIKGW